MVVRGALALISASAEMSEIWLFCSPSELSASASFDSFGTAVRLLSSKESSQRELMFSRPVTSFNPKLTKDKE